jgi:hypothetical protein
MSISAPGNQGTAPVLSGGSTPFLGASPQPVGTQEQINFAASPSAVIQGAWAAQLSGQGSIFMGNTSGAQNDEAQWEIYLAAGTWELDVPHFVNNGNGIATISIDGIPIGTVDGYAAAFGFVRSTLSPIVIAAPGIHVVDVKIATKNASSGGFGFALTVASTFTRIA